MPPISSTLYLIHSVVLLYNHVVTVKERLNKSLTGDSSHQNVQLATVPVSISVPCDFEDNNLCGWTNINAGYELTWTTGRLPGLLKINKLLLYHLNQLFKDLHVWRKIKQNNLCSRKFFVLFLSQCPYQLFRDFDAWEKKIWQKRLCQRKLGGFCCCCCFVF